MALRHEATLNLARLIKRDVDASSEVAEAGELTPTEAALEAGGLRLAGPLTWQLTVRAMANEDEMLVTGSVRGTAVQECRRCLVDVQSELEGDIMFAMRYRPGPKELALIETEDDEHLTFGRPEVDFAMLLTQMFALKLPLTALCKPGCLGLTLDGVNLNEHPEAAASARQPASGSPFAALKNLKL